MHHIPAVVLATQQPVGEKVQLNALAAVNELLFPLSYNILLIGYVVFSR